MPQEPTTSRYVDTAKMHIAYIYAFVAFASLFVFGLLQIVAENKPQAGFLELAGSVVFLVNAAGLRLTQNVGLVCNLIVLSILSMLVVMLLTGGTADTGIFWCYIFPLAAFFLTNKKLGIAWMAALFAAIGMIMIASHVHLIETPYELITLRQLMASLLVVAIGIYVYQQSHEHMAEEAKKSSTSSKEDRIKADIIVDTIGEGVVAVNLEGHVVLANKAAANMLGWDVRELYQQLFTDAVPMVHPSGKPIPAADHPLARSLKQGEDIHVDTVYARKDGSTFSAATTSKPIVVEGKVRGAIITFRDITIEQAIDHAKSEFVTLASHQLRTPISAISWVSELLLHGDAGKLAPAQKDYVQQIYHSNKRMAALVDAMLTASSLELGNLPIRPEQVDLPTIAREVLETRFAALPRNKILHIKEQYDPGLPTVLFDPSIVRTILQNLLANAFKYTPSGGTVTIVLHQDTDDIIIQVNDTGVGIPTRQQSKIFTKLFRAENVKLKDTDGTGLGLYIVKAITEYVGGSISFSSEENKGSTFTVRLPRDSMLSKVEGA